MQNLEISQIRERFNNHPISLNEVNLLIDRLESLEDAMNHWRDEFRAVDTELENLRTQKPVAWNRYDSDKFIGTIYKDPGHFNPGGVKRYEPLYANSPNFVIGGDHIFPGEMRPEDGQQVTYFFEPFRRWYTGTYRAAGDSVFGNSGFTTWLPEVTLWVKNSGDTEKNWRPIKTLPRDNPDLPVLVFADYIDEPKDIEFRTVRELEGFSQFSHWLPAPYPPRKISEWCKCEGCIDIRKNWRISAADNFFDEDCPNIVSGIEEIEMNLQKAISALADIANRRDMTLELAKKKATRIYSEIQPDEFASPKPSIIFENKGEDRDYSDLNCPACGGSGHVDDSIAQPEVAAPGPDAWINDDGETSSNEIVFEYWKAGGKLTYELYKYSSLLSKFEQDLRAIRYGVKRNKPVLHIINNIISELKKGFSYSPHTVPKAQSDDAARLDFIIGKEGYVRQNRDTGKYYLCTTKHSSHHVLSNGGEEYKTAREAIDHAIAEGGE